MKIHINSRYLGERKRARIEMLPLIDIVFLLLVFFIFAMLSMAVHRSLPVSLPLSSQAQIDTAQSLTVTVTKNGDIFFNKKRFSLDEMQVALRAEAAKAATESGKTVMVTLFAHKDISYQKLYRVLDLIRTAGIANVSLQAGADK